MRVQQFAFMSHLMTEQEVIGAYNSPDLFLSTISSTLKFEHRFTSIHFDYVIAALKTSSSMHDHRDVYANLTEVMKFTKKLFVSFYEESNHTVKFTSSTVNIVEKIARISSELKLNFSHNNQVVTVEHIALVLSLLDDIHVVQKERLVETLKFDADFQTKYKGFVKLVSTILFKSTAFSNSLVVIIENKFILNNQFTQRADLLEIIKNRIDFFAAIRFLDEEFLAYTYNTESGGITEYTNYEFNSFSWPYAAARDGIYSIDETNDTDDGVNITSSVKTGLIDFGESLTKQVPYAYLGIAESGELLLKVTSVNRGIKNERWYEVKSYNEATDTTRVQLGKGVKAKYWQFELENVEGQDLFLESTEVIPLVLKRRV